MPLFYKTPDYFRDFTCLGGDCSDTCCQHWEIKLDRQHYELLKDKMAADDQQKQKFETYIRINDKPVLGDYDYAHIHMAENGYCPMLGDDGLCEIHRCHGVEPLGNVCAFYPRVIARRENVVEMSGAMSCPEVTRLCMASKHVPKQVRFTLSQLPRAEYPITRELPRVKEDQYAKHFSHVRETFLSIIAREEIAFSTRLFAIASVANRISRFYHRDCEKVDAAMLEEELLRGESEEAFSQWQAYLKQYQSDEPVALVVIHSILQLKQEQFPDEKTSQLANSLFAALNKQSSDENWLPVFEERQQQVMSCLGDNTDKYLTRYLHNCLFREWFYTMPDTFTYVQMLLLRVAILRFLIVAHPELPGIISEWESGDVERKKMESKFFELVVNTVYCFARDIDQNMPFLQVIYNAVSEQQMMNFDYSLPFIKF